MNTTSQENGAGGRNRRSVRNLLISPAGQIRIIFGLPLLGLASVLSLLLALRFILRDSLRGMGENFPRAAERAEEIASITTRVIDVTVGIGFASTLLILVLGLLISHRFYGPIVPIVRTLREFADGNFSGRVRLRQGDELKEIQDAVNALGDTLAGGKGKP